MKKVLVSDSLAKEGVEILNAAQGLSVDVKTGLKPEQLLEIIGGYDALVIRSATKVNDAVLEAATNLKIIGRAGIGVDNVDVPAATKRGVIVMNTPAGNIVTTAEHAISLMMSLVRRVPQATSSMKEGKWEKKAFEGTEIRGKVLGVVGLGNIGSIVAELALGLKMKVYAYDPFISEERAEKMGVKLVTLEQIYALADIITIHVPLIEETKNLLNRDAFAKMKKGVYLICAARGGIVEEAALLEALESGRVAGAALDVFCSEPPGLCPLVTHPNVICTPHLGASTAEAQLAVSVQVAEQIVEYFNTGTIRNAVNIPSVPPETLSRMQPYMELARKLGRLHAQLGIEGLNTVTMEYSGRAAECRTPLLTASALSGLLSSGLGDSINMVNAPLCARERGINVVESTKVDQDNYSSLIKVTVDSNRGRSILAGAVFGDRDQRLVEIDGIPIEAYPKGHVLIFRNWDKPGIVGNIGTVLGRASINIGQFQFGRESVGGRAVVMVNLDTEATEEVLSELRALPHIVGVTKAYL